MLPPDRRFASVTLACCALVGPLEEFNESTTRTWKRIRASVDKHRPSGFKQVEQTQYGRLQRGLDYFIQLSSRLTVSPETGFFVHSEMFLSGRTGNSSVSIIQSLCMCCRYS